MSEIPESKNYQHEKKISNRTYSKLLQSGDWEFIGETTCGDVLWNNKTGELLFADGDDGWRFVETKK